MARRAVTVRTWKPGDTTTHWWVEVRPDSWVEVNREPTQEEADEHAATYGTGRTLVLTANTRYLRMFSDSYENAEAKNSFRFL
jgi:hypothetical protein